MHQFKPLHELLNFALHKWPEFNYTSAAMQFYNFPKLLNARILLSLGIPYNCYLGYN